MEVEQGKVARENLDVVVVGMGFSGIYVLNKVKGLGLKVRAYEKGNGVGGAWYWNRYPGARVDVPSLNYCYSMEEIWSEWDWTERYAGQEELERYANFVVDKLELRDLIKFSASVTSARWDAPTSRWLVDIEGGDRAATRYLVMATGTYSAPIRPAIRGIESFEGEIYFTSFWPAEAVDFTGKKVGIIGTGSSGMQTATELGHSAPLEHLYVFQRTANFALPKRNRPMDPGYQRTFKENYAEFWERARWSGSGAPVEGEVAPIAHLTDEEFEARISKAWEVGGPSIYGGITDLSINEFANNRVADYARKRIKERIDDPQIAELLTPRDHYIVARRVLTEDNYFEIYNLAHVDLVNIRKHPIEEVLANGLRTEERFYELDMIILATGFDSGTGALLRMDVTGRDGQTLSEKWSTGLRSYLGIGIAGFPNLLMAAGPGSPSIRSTGTVSAEQSGDWIADFISWMDEHGVESVEPTLDAEDQWTTHAAKVADATLLTKNDTQYVGANVPGKPRVFLCYIGGTGLYRRICDGVRKADYEGFVLRTPDGVIPAADTWAGLPEGAISQYGNGIPTI
ncbi:MAG TPA: NAD(P)/FAD-dependent oxidoreductase [Acidimicrobiales bacterium]|jgi:cation diffusion facilitator CzcD-associated flavoprotein CzcO